MPTIRPFPYLVHLAATTVLIAMTVAGCASSQDEPVDEDSYQAFAARIAEQARAEGATAEQLDLIADAEANGEMSFADVGSAIAATFACLDEVGVQHKRDPDSLIGTYRIPNYSYFTVAGEMDDITLKNLGDTCMAQNSEFVELLYSTQPGIYAEREAQFEEARPRLIECLRDNGAFIEDESSSAELQDAAQTLLMGADESWNGPDCMRIVGLIE